MGPKALVVVACVVSLAVGFGLGVTVGVHADQRHEGRLPRIPGATTEEKLDTIVAELTRRVEISPEQAPRVRAVLRPRIPQFEALLSEMKPRFEAVKRDAFKDLETVLTPSQLEPLRAREERRE